MCKRYELIIFDFDGTLADTFEWFVKNINTVAKRYRFKQLDLERLDEFRGFSAREMMRHAELSLWKLPLVAREMRRLMSEKIDDIELFDGVNSLFQELWSQGIKIAIVTSNSKENVIRVLGPGNITFVSHFGCSAPLFGKKAKVKAVIKTSGVAMDKVLYIGDEIRDAEMARALEIDFAGVSWGYTKPEALHRFGKIPIMKNMGDVLPVACGE